MTYHDPNSLEGGISVGDVHGRWHLQAGILSVYLGPDLKLCWPVDGRAPEEQAGEMLLKLSRMN